MGWIFASDDIGLGTVAKHLAQMRLGGDVPKDTGCVILVKGVGFALIVGHDQIEISVIVIITGVDAHSTFSNGVFAHRDTVKFADFGE